jgi:exopolysaccharide biosynthesis polyprenyl glycosylphosphotransferase
LEQQADQTHHLNLGETELLTSARVEAFPRTKGSALVQYRRLAYAMVVTDVLSVLVAFLLAFDIRFGLVRPPLDFLVVVALAPLVLVSLFAGFRLYRVQYFGSAELLRRIVAAVTIAISIIVTISFWSKASLSREWIGLSWIFTTAFILLSRRIWHWRMGHARRKGNLTFRTLIVGTNDEAARLAQLMSAHTTGFRPLGFVSTDYPSGNTNGLPIMGDISDLDHIIQMSGADCVFVASTSVTPSDISHVTKTARLQDVDMRISANLPEMLSSRLTIQPFGGFMALHLRPARLTGTQAVAKRTFDLVFAAIAMAVTFPLWTLIAIAIKMSSRGPILYRQERIGRLGRPFVLLKFRTMVSGAHAMRDTLTEHNEASLPLFKIRSDPRVTRVGRWLRKYSLDELPQLLNVLRGSMSLVGPRPPLPEEVDVYTDWHFDRLQVQPGITGLWQTSGRSDLSFDEYVRLDLFYIENWSLAYDLFILAKTVPVLLMRTGAY